LSERHTHGTFLHVPFVHAPPRRASATTTARPGVEQQVAPIAQITGPLVAPRHADERCARSGGRDLQIRQCRRHRPIAETLVAREPSAPWHAISVGHVDAQFLSQPGGPEFTENASARARARERKTARSVRADTVAACLYARASRNCRYSLESVGMTSG